MQIYTTLTWYVLALVSCHEQRWMKQESTPFGITPDLQPGQFLSTINSIGWPALSISSPSLLLLEEPKGAIPTSIKMLKDESNFQQCLVATSSTPHQGPKPNWEASLLRPRYWFSYFSAICTSQSHRFVQSPTMKPVTFLGGNYKRRCAHQAIDPKGQVSYPTHLWYPTSSFSAWHLPALPGCGEQPWVCSTFLLLAQKSIRVSRRKQGVQSWPVINRQHCCFLTYIHQ